MISHAFLHLFLLFLGGLSRLAAAGSDHSAYLPDDRQQPLKPPIAVANTSSSDGEGELLMDECDATITACGTTADVKVIRTHKSTSYVTNLHVFERITTVSTSTRTFTEVKVSTNTTSVEGQCRDTTIYEETTPLTVTVDVNTTTVKEFVHIVPTTITTVSIVGHKQTAQCIIKRTTTGLISSPHPEPSSTPSGNESSPVQPISSEISPPGTALSPGLYVDDTDSAQAGPSEPSSIEDAEREDTSTSTSSVDYGTASGWF